MDLDSARTAGCAARSCIRPQPVAAFSEGNSVFLVPFCFFHRGRCANAFQLRSYLAGPETRGPAGCTRSGLIISVFTLFFWSRPPPQPGGRAPRHAAFYNFQFSATALTQSNSVQLAVPRARSEWANASQLASVRLMRGRG